MKYLKEFGWILLVSFLGEVLRGLIPLPVPASIYGLLLMLFALRAGLIPLRRVEATADFLIEIMPVMFIPAAVGLLDSWVDLREIWLQVSIITILTTILVMAVSGRVTQSVIRRGRKKNHETDA